MMQHDFIVVGGDTDSIMFKKKNESAFIEAERMELLSELNSLMPEKITWEDDNYFKRVLYVKAKNYVMDDGKKLDIKGSALKATMKEPALKQFILEMINLLLHGKPDHIYNLYLKYAYEIQSLTSIDDWCFKKTVTKSILTPQRTNESRIFDAIRVQLESKQIREGDKVYLFFKTSTEYSVREEFNGQYDQSTLLSKLYKTLCIFESLLDTSVFPNFALKRNQGLLLKAG